MLSLPHAAVGAAIGLAIPAPVFSLPLAVFSHFLTDQIPHWNPHLDTEMRTRRKLSTATLTIIFIDLALAVILMFWVGQYSLVAAICGLCGILPDLVEAPHYFLNLKIKPVEKLINFQRSHQFHTGPLFGLSTQVIILAICFLVINSYLA